MTTPPDSNEAPSPSSDTSANLEEVASEEAVEEAEPEGPDLSSLDPAALALLDSMLATLESYGSQPLAPLKSGGSDLPQVSVERQHIVDVCRTLKDDDRFGARMLLCMSAVDNPPDAVGEQPVVQMVYILQSLEPERTMVVKTEAPYDDPVMPSVTGVWRAADWYEREAHDLFGVTFVGHPDLAPLLLYEEFEGHPGRKDFAFYEYREF